MFSDAFLSWTLARLSGGHLGEILALETAPSVRPLAPGREEFIYFPGLLCAPGDLCSCPPHLLLSWCLVEAHRNPHFVFLEGSPKSEKTTIKQMKLN